MRFILLYCSIWLFSLLSFPTYAQQDNQILFQNAQKEFRELDQSFKQQLIEMDIDRVLQSRVKPLDYSIHIEGQDIPVYSSKDLKSAEELKNIFRINPELNYFFLQNGQVIINKNSITQKERGHLQNYQLGQNNFDVIQHENSNTYTSLINERKEILGIQASKSVAKHHNFWENYLKNEKLKAHPNLPKNATIKDILGVNGLDCPTCTVGPGIPHPGIFSDLPRPKVLNGGKFSMYDITFGGKLHRRSDGYTAYKYDPLGFLEITLLSLTKNNKRDKICTGVFFAKNYLLTALHCLADDAGNLRTKVLLEEINETSLDRTWLKAELVNNWKIQAVFNFDHPETKSEKKPSSINTVFVKNIYIPMSIDQIDKWNNNKPPPSPDLMLLEIEKSTDIAFPKKMARLPHKSSLNKIKEITFAGFGKSNVKYDDWENRFLIAPGIIAKKNKDTLFWKVDEHGGGGPCVGDSGGPVFNNWQHGFKDEIHEILAIVSFGGQDIEYCETTEGGAVMLYPFNNDICHISKNAVNGCG